MIIYADDTCKMVARNELSVSIKAENVAVEEFARWCKNSEIEVNISKTVFMICQQKKIACDYCPLIKIDHKSRASEPVQVSRHYNRSKTNVGNTYKEYYIQA